MASFLADAGLAERTVFYVDFEPDGVVWLAASDGLYRYDGYTWSRFSTEHGLPSNYVRCVLVADDGRLWVGTERGAGTFEEERFVPADAASGLVDSSVRRIVEDGDGTLWFCSDQWPDRTAPGGLRRLRDGMWKTFGEEDGLPSTFVTDLYRDSRGRGFVLTHGGLGQLDGDRVTNPVRDAGLPGHDQTIWTMFESPSQGVVAVSYAHRFALRDGEWSRLEGGIPGLPHPKLVETRDGSVITCDDKTWARLLRLDGDELVPVSSAFLGSTTGIQVLSEAPDGAIWVGGANVLVRWERTGGEWQVHADLPQPQIRDRSGRAWFADYTGRVQYLEAGREHVLENADPPLVEDSYGNVWYRTASGLGRLSSHGTEEFDAPKIGARPPMGWVAGSHGTLWGHGVQADGSPALARFDGHDWDVLPLGVSDAAPRISYLLADSERGAWVVYSSSESDLYQLARVRSEGTEEVSLPPRVSGGRTPGVCADSYGRLWVYGFAGLFRRRAEPDSEWVKIEDVPGGHVFDVVERGDELWFAFSGTTGGWGGLARIRGEQWSLYPEVIRNFAGRDKDGTLFFACADGVCVVPPGEDVEPSILSVPSSMRVLSALRDDAGSLWIGLEEGALRYHPDGVPPETLILSTPAQSYGEQEWVLHVAGLEAFKPRSQRARFSYSFRAEGEPWSRFKLLPEDGFAVPGLSVGKHTLEVRVRDEGMDVDPVPARVEVEIFATPLQARWWFWPATLVLLISLGSLAALAYAAKRRLAGHARSLEGTVRRRTLEFQRSERKYRNLFEQSGDAVYLTGSEGAVTDSNSATSELIGYARSELEGLRPSDVFLQERDLKALEAALSQHGELRDFPCRVRTSAGKYLDVRVTANYRLNDDGKVEGTQVILRDVTVRKRLEERLRQNQKMEAVGRLAGGIAHDFNNLLTAIVGYGELLSQKVRGDSFLEGDVQNVLEAASRARALTGQIQTFSRGQIVEPKVVELNRVVSGMEGLLRRILGEDVTLVSTLDPDAGCVHIDPGQLEQVIVNLAVNARDAMPGGGLLTLETGRIVLDADTALEAHLGGEGEFVVLAVRDSGTGMEEGTLGKIFEPFFTTKDRGKGSGLGLATVYGIVDQNEGGIKVESSIGKGTTFRIFLPPCENQVEEAPTVLVPTEVAGGSETVLVVEDEKAIRELIERLLEEAGYRVISAEHADAAEAAAASFDGRIDLLLTDVVLPGRKGFELAEDMTAERPDLPTLYMSGYAESERTDSFQWQGNEPVLKKPFLPAALLRRVRECLDAAAETRGALLGRRSGDPPR